MAKQQLKAENRNMARGMLTTADQEQGIAVDDGASQGDGER